MLCCVRRVNRAGTFEQLYERQLHGPAVAFVAVHPLAVLEDHRRIAKELLQLCRLH